MKAVGMFAGGISAYDSGKYTRRVMDTNRQNALNAGVMQRDRIRESARMAMGQQLVAQGSSGAGVGTGSALDALHASAINRELDLALSRAGASAQAGDYARKGFMAYQQGKAALARRHYLGRGRDRERGRRRNGRDAWRRRRRRRKCVRR
jgi:hypothetical protein